LAVADRQRRQRFWTDVMNGEARYEDASLKDHLRAVKIG